MSYHDRTPRLTNLFQLWTVAAFALMSCGSPTVKAVESPQPPTVSPTLSPTEIPSTATAFPSPTVVPTVEIPPLLPTPESPTQYDLCMDTMKASRDRARENWSYAEVLALVEKAAIGNCLAIGTPYNAEFYTDKAPIIYDQNGQAENPEDLSVMGKWVYAARQFGLNVWFRGNLAGWEKQWGTEEAWFGYPVFTNVQQHHDLIRQFINDNKDKPGFFQEGDIFTPAPEPENGAVLGSYWEHKEEYWDFLIASYNNADQALKEANIQGVRYGFYSMNADVAMDIPNDVYAALGNVLVVDHYTEEDPTEMGRRLQALHDRHLNVSIVVGEFGAPIPDRTGDLNDQQQAKFIGVLVAEIVGNSFVTGMNYWTLWDGSTALIEKDLIEKPAYKVLSDAFASVKQIK